MFTSHMSVSSDLGYLYLPQDVIKEILSRLPAKSVGRFRCVSKSWLHLTTHPDFIDSHLKQQKQKLLYSADSSLFTLDYEGQDMVPLELDFPLRNPFLVGAVNMFGSCNGLICISPQPLTFFVFNPCTGESLRIPHFHVPSFLHSSSTFSYSEAHSFGYAPSIKDYKFVMIEQRVVFTFSLKTKSWKRVPDFPCVYVSGDLGAPLNGAIHWLCKNPGGQPVIVALDLAEEKFSKLPTPESIKDFQKYETGALRGCLCLLERDQCNWPCSFWVMEEFGVKESWSRILISADPRTCLALRPLCYIKNTMVLLLINGMELILGNPKNGSCIDYLEDGFLGVVYDTDLYVESLVSPNISEKKCSCV